MRLPNALHPIKASEAGTYERYATFVRAPVAELRRGNYVRTCPSCGFALITGSVKGLPMPNDAFRCHCGQWCIDQESTNRPRSKYSILPETVYRYFDNETFYNDFLAGNVWISTLSACRNSEDVARADDRENLDVVMLHDRLLPGRRLFLGNKSVTEHPDQHVLCVSSELSMDLAHQFCPSGTPFVVAIHDLTSLYDAIARGIQNNGGVLIRGEINRVTYDARELTEGETRDPGCTWFEKPSRFAHEKEIRAVWHPKANLSIAPGMVRVQNVLRWVAPASIP